MKNIKKWLSLVTENSLHASNKVHIRKGMALSFNFLQIPSTSTVIIAVTIMKNRVKKNALNSGCFAKIMGIIEHALYSTLMELNTSEKMEEEYFVRTNDILSNQWYIRLGCHRIFFIPKTSVWSVISNLFYRENVMEMRFNDLDEISVSVDTDDYNFHSIFDYI